MITFLCPKCLKRRDTTGRKKYKRVGTGSDGRPTYNYICFLCDQNVKLVCQTIKSTCDKIVDCPGKVH